MTLSQVGLLILCLSFLGCSLSGKITKYGQNSELISPIETPVQGSDDLKLNDPTEFINSLNQNHYILSGICKTSDVLIVEVNDNIVKSDLSCDDSLNFSITLDLSSYSSGVLKFKIYFAHNSNKESTVSIVKDTQAPVMVGSVTDGVYYNSSSRTPTLTWVAGSDDYSGITSYELAVGNTSGATDVLAWTSIGNVTSYYQSGLVLISGNTYYASIRAKDGAGNYSVAINSDGWIVDSVAPTLATAFTDGEINFSNTSTKVMSWAASNDSGSGLSGYELALGTTAGGTDVMNWTNMGNVVTATIDSLTLFGNRRYYASLRTLDNAGNRTSIVSDGGWWNLRQSKKAVDISAPEARWFSGDSRFGFSVALSEDGNTMVVGAPYDKFDDSGLNSLTNAGAAFVYIKSGGNWVFQQKLVASGINSRGGQFGTSVSISGDTIVVGAHLHGYDQNGDFNVNNAGAAFVFTRAAGVWSQQQKLVGVGNTNARIASDSFGTSVAISGDTIVVGANGQDYDAGGGSILSQAGAAFVFIRSSGVWSLQQKLVGVGNTNARIASDLFGANVAINNNTIAIGATGQDFNAAGAGSVSNSGAVYVFLRSSGTWSLQQKLVGVGNTNARVASDSFGSAISIDGDTLVVGAMNQDFDVGGFNSIANAGAAYVFLRSSGTWSLQQKLVGTGNNGRITGDTFGYRVSISGDTLVVGADRNDTDVGGHNAFTDTGAAFIFTRTAGSWDAGQKITGTGVNGRITQDYFGSAVSISNGIVAVGAYQQDYDQNGEQRFQSSGAIYSFEKPSSSWQQQQKVLYDMNPVNRSDLASLGFGQTVAISDDGNTLVVGAAYDDTDALGANYMSDSGAVFIYVKNAGHWVFQQKIVASGTHSRFNSGEIFGSSLDIDGDTIVVGSNNMYDSNDQNPAPASGAVYVFTRSAGLWSQQAKITPSGLNSRIDNDSFGWSVAISGDTIAVGASGQDYDENGQNGVVNAGAVYVYIRSGSTWTQQQKIVASGLNERLANDNFGGSVSLDGDTLVTGAIFQSYDSGGDNQVPASGAAYVFTRSGSVWSQQQKLVASGVNARLLGDSFGISVSLSNDLIAVSASGHSYDQNGQNEVSAAGAVYVYIRSGSTWTQQQKIVASGVNARMANDNFGSSVCIKGSTLAIGSFQQAYDQNGDNLLANAGAVYVYKLRSSQWQTELRLFPTGTSSRIVNSYFGSSVAVSENGSADGYSISVGASGNSYDSTGSGALINGSGSIYIYD